jgi:LmbE family N-acetylglucosaminyl deacetylase
MKIKRPFYSGLILMVLLFACKPAEDVRPYAPVESYPEDTILAGIQEKRAMIVIAHDDDMCGMAGTISKLNKMGWEIGVISFSKSEERNAAQIKACRTILDTVMFIELQPEEYRKDLTGEVNPYYAIPKERFDSIFNRALVETELLKRLQAFKPTVLFSLDNEMGGYGHPEHVFMSQLIIDLANEGRITPKYIYQSVYTDHMENSIMARHARRMKSWGFPGDEWENAKKAYGVDGMPVPSVQLSITSEANEKMDYLKSYNKRERKVMGFFIPEFERYDAETYFAIFDREFFRVLSF